MKIGGIILLLSGLLAMSSGVIGAVGSQIIPREECELADQYKAEADRLNQEADAVRGMPGESRLREQALDKMKSSRIWAVGCEERKTNTMIALLGGLAVAALGFVMSVAGILLFLRGRRSAQVKAV
jgi:hypothetical protein